MELIECEWSKCRAGYELNARTIRAKSGRKDYFDRYRPLKVDALFTKFAMDFPTTAKGMLEFSNQYGLPGSGTGSGGTPGVWPRVCDVDLLLSQQKQMRGAHVLFEQGDSSELIRVCNGEGLIMARMHLHRDPGGALSMVCIPPDLIRAMWLQFALHACSGARLLRCSHCNEPFTVGARTKRRETRIFCKDACKQAAYRSRKAD